MRLHIYVYLYIIADVHDGFDIILMNIDQAKTYEFKHVKVFFLKKGISGIQ